MTNHQRENELLYQLFRFHQYVIGTTDTSILCLRSLVVALGKLKCTKETIKEQIEDLFAAIRDSRPKLVILTNLIRYFEREIEAKKIFESDDVASIKEAVIGCVQNCVRTLNSKIDALTDHGVNQVSDGDCIMVHSVNEPVQRILPAAKERGKNFKVLILRQDQRKTEQIVRYMNSAGIEYTVTPEHAVSHFAVRATKMFVGAVAITGDNKMVCAAGTSNIVSIARLYELPVYLFINSLKFSHLPSTEHNINEEEQIRSQDDVDYTEISYSHDLVELKVIDHVFTENGKIGAKEIDEFQRLSTIDIVLA